MCNYVRKNNTLTFTVITAVATQKSLTAVVYDRETDNDCYI